MRAMQTKWKVRVVAQLDKDAFALERHGRLARSEWLVMWRVEAQIESALREME